MRQEGGAFGSKRTKTAIVQDGPDAEIITALKVTEIWMKQNRAMPRRYTFARRMNSMLRLYGTNPVEFSKYLDGAIEAVLSIGRDFPFYVEQAKVVAAGLKALQIKYPVPESKKA